MDIVTLIEELVNGLLAAEEDFLKDPKDFYSMEKAVKSSTDATAAKFLSGVLSGLDECIRNSGFRDGRYSIQRKDSRTLISSVGDISFDCTYYKSLGPQGGYTYLLEDVIGLSRHERFTEEAEVELLEEALHTSYERAASKLPTNSKITRTTVMDKIHRLSEQIPCEEPKEKKSCGYLFIEADEDHVSEQHGRWNNKDNHGFISRLAYVYEYKQDDPEVKGRRELVNTFYFGGLYPGSDGIERFWTEVADYIEKNYDAGALKRIYISGDGAQWIRSGTQYIEKSLFCADKFHLMKYINAAAGQMLDEKDVAKSELWHLLYKKSRREFKGYTDSMARSAGNTDPIMDLQTYVLGNWSAVMRTLHDKKVEGCCAESHVSHVLSDRLSSRPLGWSQTGADRMSRLRCYEKNFGKEKIIDLVRYTREQEKRKRTGTDDIPVSAFRTKEVMYDHYDQARSYIERMQATIPGLTARKSATIRMHLNLL